MELTRRAFSRLSMLLATKKWCGGCKNPHPCPEEKPPEAAPKPRTIDTQVFLKNQLGIDDDPWGLPRIRMYDKDLLRYAQADAEATMLLREKMDELYPHQREYWIIRAETEAANLQELRRQRT